MALGYGTDVKVGPYVRKRPSIERFSGISVPGWAGPRPGGGMRGATKELDDAVAHAAKRLAAHYGRDVQIRFNSDRQSGGAFVKLASGKEVGVNARLRDGKIVYGAIISGRPTSDRPFGEVERSLDERVDTFDEAFTYLKQASEPLERPASPAYWNTLERLKEQHPSQDPRLRRKRR